MSRISSWYFRRSFKAPTVLLVLAETASFLTGGPRSHSTSVNWLHAGRGAGVGK